MVSSLFILLAFVGSNNRLHDMGHVSESVDLIELNHFYDRQGRHVYDQVIFYERLASTGQYRVRAWCLVEDRESLNRRLSGMQQRTITMSIGSTPIREW